MKKNIRTIFTKYKREYEVINGKSLTIPDQTMSIEQIMKRYAAGMSLGGTNKVPIYNGEEDVPDFKRMDLAEIEEYKRGLKQYIQERQINIEETRRNQTSEIQTRENQISEQI
jgi:hypothetical protein